MSYTPSEEEKLRKQLLKVGRPLLPPGRNGRIVVEDNYANGAKIVFYRMMQHMTLFVDYHMLAQMVVDVVRGMAPGNRQFFIEILSEGLRTGKVPDPPRIGTPDEQ
jgi:hypothetical protein